ncbi:glycosyltransferase family 9 protein [uncultured Sphingomonas sp.]|uniref:glycosyltransferase family 9 protein n=1 Tax=uncultured Sphingomonas sp. TaxID=158754 RepID=UPI0025CE7B28|nr:glycosyltransferase family 9 protein [uncultured Sphingomonas sp.]
MTTILIAPFSNSGIRDWPGSHFSALIGLILPRVAADAIVYVTGTASHRLRANEIVRAHPADRVVNLAGRQSRDAMIRLLKTADGAVVNNSGMAHLGGYFGIPTVSIFAGTHQRREWRALGGSVMLVTRAIGCSPCQLDHGQTSPYNKACLRQITPGQVADALFANMKRVSAMRNGSIAA